MMTNTNPSTLYTAAALLGELSARRAHNTLSAPVRRFSLARQLRAARVTIREIAAELGVTLARVREVRTLSAAPYLVALDYVEAIERIADRKAGR